MVLKVDHKPVDPIINVSTKLLQPSIARDEIDGNRVSKCNNDEDTLATTATAGVLSETLAMVRSRTS